MRGPEDSTPDAEGGYANAACLDACSFGPPSGPDSPFTGSTDD